MKVTETLFSKFYNFFYPLDWAKRAVLISASQTIILGSLEVVILSGTIRAIELMFGSMAGSAGFIVTYFVLFIMAQLFSTAMQADAWVSKNTMQVVAVALFNIFTCVYSVVQVFHLQRVKKCGMEYLDNRYNNLTLAYKLTQLSSTGDCPKTDAFAINGPPGTINANGLMINVEHSVSNMEEGSLRIQQGIDIISGLIPIAAVISGLCILYSMVGIFTCFKVYQEYGWCLVQKNGASVSKRNMLKRYHLFILFLKLDVFFACGIITQMVGAAYYYNKQSGLDMDPKTAISKGFLISACAIMCTVASVYYTIGWFAVKRSNYYLMSAFLILMIVESIALSYAIYIASTEAAFRITLIWLTSFATVQIFLTIGTIVVAFSVMSDFKNGELNNLLNPIVDHTEKMSPKRLILD